MDGPLLSVIILSSLFIVTAVMAGALTIAWKSFGHPRHAASWAVSFGLSALQAAVNGLALYCGRQTLLMAAAFILIPPSGLLAAMGARQRARKPSRRRLFLGILIVESLFILISRFVHGLGPIGLASATFVSAGGLFLAAWTIRPGARASQPAERALAISFAMLGGVELATSILTAASMILNQSTPVRRAYQAVLTVGLPPAAVCVGAAAILLVASDLAVELGRLAARDPLTGLFNRRGFQEGAVRSLANIRRNELLATVVVADIDHFKAINDRHGHTAGDRILCFLAEQLGGGVRQGDLVARIGGEEFALLFVSTDTEGTCEVVERIRGSIALGHVFDGETIPVTASFGVAPVKVGHGDLDTILARALDNADRALYLSKVQGRNRVTVRA